MNVAGGATPRHSLDFAVLDALCERAFGQPPAGTTEMPGGASTRKYFRIALGDGKSCVAMFVPEGAVAEEVEKGAGLARRWPFLEVRDLLAARGVDVPRIFGEDTARGWIVLEDLGDDTLANYLLRNEGSRAGLYTRAVLDLAAAQRALADLPPDSIVRGRAFDHELLLWEIHHFREWGLEAQGLSLAAEPRVRFDHLAERLARRIADLPRGFTHRDYQSRNLMVRDGETLAWIDFQDALLGPRVYDLVALLNDSYQVFDRAFVEARLAEYGAAAGLPAEERAQVVRQFDLVTVQRKLKDAGRFVFIDRVKKNPSFLKFVGPTMKKVRASLGRLAHDDEDMRALSDLLAQVMPAE